MNILETDQWCLLLPPEWVAGRDDDIVHIRDRDDVGELEITTLCRDDGTIALDEVKAMAAQESPEVSEWQPANFGGFVGVGGHFVEDGAAISEGYVAQQGVLLYVTYLCDEQDAGMDMPAVLEMLSTLVLGDSSAA